MAIYADEDMLQTVKLALRVSSEMYDDEVMDLIEAAFEDMERVGIDEDYLSEFGPKVRHAVVCFCKSMFGFDNSMASFFSESYRQHVTDLLNSRHNVCASKGGTGNV